VFITRWAELLLGGDLLVNCHWLFSIFLCPSIRLQPETLVECGAGQINVQVVWTLY